jgi:shikimate kinase
MATGKTTVGRRLARLVNRPFVDNDEQLETRTGLTARAYSGVHGTEALHEQEREVLLAALDEPTASVIAAAASIVDDPALEPVLAHGAVVIWLTAPPAVLAKRAEGQDHRPDDAGSPSSVAEQAERRAAAFERIADLTVRADRAPEDVVADILERLRTDAGFSAP